MNTQPNPETRFDRGAWLTLAISILLLLLPVVPTLIGINYPSDGWVGLTTSSAQNRFKTKVTSQPSPLQTGDILLAINGQTFDTERLPPLPPNLQIGQVLRYTIQRGNQTVDVNVTLVRRTLSEVLRATIQHILANPATTIPAALCFFIALPLFLLRPRNPAARYMLIIFSYYGPTSAIGLVDYHFYRWSYPAWIWLLHQLEGAGWVLWFFPSWTLLALSMPVRKWPLTRFPRLVPALLYGWPFTFAVANYVVTIQTGSFNNDLLNSLAFLPVTLAFLVALVGSLFHNFLTLRDPVARAQLRWLALGLGLGWGAPIAVLTYTVMTNQLNPETDIVPLWLTVLLPVSLAIAILRHRLFDIDLIIRRTLQYSLLSGLLALTFFGLVVVLQNIFSAVSGQSSPVILVLSTLAIYALFLPLRRRVQDFIDRRFYRRKYDAAKVIADFAATCRDETDLDTLTARLVEVVEETMQPESVALWMKPTADGRPPTAVETVEPKS